MEAEVLHVDRGEVAAAIVAGPRTVVLDPD
jgi:hypothetical protein